jgi:deoxyribodipyrimidine photo-lyase
VRSIVWFRGKDLRVADHEPLRAAAVSGEVIPLFVLDPHFFEPRRARALPHRMQYLLEALTDLKNNLEQLGTTLLLAEGPSIDVVPKLARRWRADRVVAQRWSEPVGRERDRIVAARLHVPLELMEGELLRPPGTLRTAAGLPYSVFTPFSRRFLSEEPPPAPRAAPKRLPKLPSDVRTASASLPNLEALGLTRNPMVIRGGESAAKKRLSGFVRATVADYSQTRDQLGIAGTSRLSADLKFGCLSARQVWAAVERANANERERRAFLRQLIWREFAHGTLWDRPSVLRLPFQRRFLGFPWRWDESEWCAWVNGGTGYPIVDASARQLLSEGFVHNRARMISASFLTKHLLIDYRRGEAHYLKYLVDGDWAQNNLGWQWAAGTGCDAQPYFRVFNPVAQGEKFDAQGGYVRRWVPELAALPDRFIHRPWEAPAAVLLGAKVELGVNYPLPVVAHAAARERYLAVVRRHLSSAGPPKAFVTGT